MHSGDGTRVTSVVDSSGRGGDMVEGTAAHGPVYRADVGGYPCLEFTDGWLKTSTSAALPFAVATGGIHHDYCVMMVAEVKENVATASNYWAFTQSSASTRWLQLRHTATTALHPEYLQSTNTGAKTTLQSSEPMRGCWHVITVRKRGGTIQFRIDGVTQSEQSSTDVDTITIDTFAIGAIATAIPTIGGEWRFRMLRAYNGGLLDSDMLAAEAQIGKKYGLDWKAQLGASVASPLVVGMLGQSNSVGQGTAPWHTVAGSNIYMLALDGMRKTLAEPSHYGVNQTGGLQHDDPHNLGSYAAKFADQLRTYKANPLIIVPCSKESTPSSSWAQAGSTLTTLLSSAKHHIRDALKASGAKLAPIVIYQGESNTSNTTEANSWLTDWRNILTDLEAEFTGSIWACSKHYVIVRLPPTPYVSSDATSWALVRTNAQTLINERSDTIGIDAPDTVTPFLHLRTAELETLGTLIADAMGAVL